MRTEDRLKEILARQAAAAKVEKDSEAEAKIVAGQLNELRVTAVGYGSAGLGTAQRNYPYKGFHGSCRPFPGCRVGRIPSLQALEPQEGTHGRDVQRS